MAEITRFSPKCFVKQANTSKLVEAEVMNFNEKKNLVVVINKSVKMLMSWNGRVYEGRMAGLDFVSDGPAITKTSVSLRG